MKLKHFKEKLYLKNFSKTLRTMKLVIILMLLGVSSAFSNTYSQTTLLTFDVRKESIKEVINVIEKKSEYVFFFSNDLKKDIQKKVNVHADAKTLDKILDDIFAGTGLSYKIKDRQVMVFRDDKKSLNTTESAVIQQKKTVKGKIIDNLGDELPGATVTVEGSTRGVSTDTDGTYSIDVEDEDKLVFSYLGMESQTILVGTQTEINVTLKEKSDMLNEVTVVAFGKQKKESLISSIQTVNTKDLKVPSSNLTTAFAGRIAGLIAYQTSGEPGQDNADFFIRGVTSFGAGKVDPLILIDNVEVSSNDLSRLHPDDIQSFAILKDATATALYGARGANGVILVTTKEGKEGKVKISVRLENSFSSATKKVEMADPITYMRLANEAVSTRNPLAPIPYSNSQIDNTIRGGNPYVYPAVDWMDMLTKSSTMNQRANINISGGGSVARYYIAGSFSQDNGVLKVDKRNNFNNNIDLKKYLIRSNININLTSSTEAIVRLHGTFDDYTGPVNGGTDMYKKILQVSPVRFPAYFAPDDKYANVSHILFGGYQGDQYMNPYAEMVKGYKQESKSVLMAQMELKQDLDKWVKGLSARLLGNTTRSAGFDVTRAYSPYYYEIGSYDRFTNKYTLTELNPAGGTEFIDYNPGEKTVSSSFYGEASVAYNSDFEEHNMSGMLVGIVRNSLTGNAKTLSESLQKRNLGISGRFTYGYDSRYLAEFNFGYNGSEKFDKGHRWGFFPSFGIGWSVSNESFWSDKLKEVVNKLKLRATYGLVGNDEIGDQRFFYLSQVNIGGGDNYTTGYEFNGISHNGVKINNYPNPKIGWEIAYKTNLGLEIGLLNGKIDIIADIFKEKRTNILQPRADIPSSMGLWATPDVNVGEANGKGMDISVDYNHSINNDMWFVGRANFTYARSTYRYYEEPDFSETPWKSKIGQSAKQQWGYVAERLFIDEADIANSPRQDFGEYLPGDIKYKDINSDGVINEIDMVPIGHPNTPEINYGFGLSFGYKNFDISAFFQGSARSSFWIDFKAMSPFASSTDEKLQKTLETGLAQFITEDYWSLDSQNPYAGWPRLANTVIANNNQKNTMFMQDGAFLRFKSAEIGYALPNHLIHKLGLSSCRVYANGTNLLLFSNFKLWDVEMGGNGLGYPLQRVINLGLNISF
ncbi:TonB-dependent receptor [Dysgonomonas termitidis]|uniref:TonB-dependent receptor n=1 Tax=Dysgonomonas termitidis TaxID=1516126 RepID=A0ABV9KXY1_9BACT